MKYSRIKTGLKGLKKPVLELEGFQEDIFHPNRERVEIRITQGEDQVVLALTVTEAEELRRELKTAIGNADWNKRDKNSARSSV